MTGKSSSKPRWELSAGKVAMAAPEPARATSSVEALAVFRSMDKDDSGTILFVTAPEETCCFCARLRLCECNASSAGSVAGVVVRAGGIDMLELQSTMSDLGLSARKAPARARAPCRRCCGCSELCAIIV